MQDSPLRIPLAAHLLDRDADARSRDDLGPGLLADPATIIVPLWHGRTLVERTDGRTARLRGIPADAAHAADLLIYLGIADEPEGRRRIAAVPLTDAAAAIVEPDADAWLPLRTAAVLLGEAEVGFLVSAVALANWHDSHGFCPRCGAATEVRQAGWVRFCPNEGIEIFPRTDPAVIVAILDADDRVLLGSNARWQPGRYSLLAGFVEAGESLEHAVEREMAEESGLAVTDVRYRGSQPWPFPASIMLGFTARLADGVSTADIRPDGAEILDLRWFSRDDIRTAAGGIMLPGRPSIARAILEDWYGEPLPDEKTPW